jgi:hypothetical protein
MDGLPDYLDGVEPRPDRDALAAVAAFMFALVG